MPKRKTPIASPYQRPPTMAAGIHDPDLARTYMFDDMQDKGRRPLAEITIGRDKECDITVRAKHASRVHVRLERQRDGSMMVLDAESTNGISIDGRPVFEPTLLRVGVRLRLGNAHLYAVDAVGRIPITATTVEDYVRRAAIVYGNNTLAGKRIGLSRETVRRRANGAKPAEGESR